MDANQLPDIAYPVAIDLIYFVTYVLILSGIIISIAVLMANLRRKELMAKRLGMFGRCGLTNSRKVLPMNSGAEAVGTVIKTVCK